MYILNNFSRIVQSLFKKTDNIFFSTEQKFMLSLTVSNDVPAFYANLHEFLDLKKTTVKLASLSLDKEY